MRKHLLLTIAFLVGVLLAGAQNKTNVFRVRLDHKWHFVSFLKDGDTVRVNLPPLDAVSDSFLTWNTFLRSQYPSKSPYMLFEADGKVGLIDSYFKVVLPNRFQRIRPLDKEHFAVETDSLFTVVALENGNWVECLKGKERYDDIVVLGTGSKPIAYFLVKKGDYWGVHGKFDFLLVKPEFMDLQFAGYPGYFKVKRRDDKNNDWWLLDPKGKFALPFGCKDVLVLDDGLFAYILPDDDFWLLNNTQKEEYHELFKVEGFMPTMSRRDLLAKFAFKSFQKLNRHFATFTYLSNEGKIGLYNIRLQQKMVDTPFVSYEPLDGDFILGRRNTMGGWAILDSSKQMVCKETFQLVDTTGITGLYKVMKNGLWGLLSLRRPDSLLQPCALNNISLFENNIAFCQFQGKTGALAYSDGRLSTLPCIYNNLEREDDDKVVDMATQQAFLFDRQLGFTSDDQGFGQDVQVKTFGALRYEVEAHAMGKPKLWKPKTKRSEPLPSHPFYVADSTVQIKYHGGWWRFIATSKNRQGPTDSVLYAGAKSVSATVAALYPIENPAMGSADLFLKKRLSQMLFYDLTKKKNLTSHPMMGFRPFNPCSPYTAFVDTTLQMGLIDQTGRQKKTADGHPFRCSYIGPFVKGVARFCKGGKLTYATEGSSPLNDLDIGSEGEIYSDFNLVDPSQAVVNTEDGGQTSSIRRLFVAKSEDGGVPKWGFIDSTGAVIVDATYDYALDFDGRYNVTLVCNANNKQKSDVTNADYGLVNRRGHLVQPVRFTRFYQFNGQLLGAMDSTLTFCYDNKGRQIFTNQVSPEPFVQGLARFRSPEMLWGFVDTTGQVVIKPQYCKAENFSEGLAAVVDSSGKWVFIDQNQKMVFSTDLDEDGTLGKFLEQRCKIKRVFKKGFKWGYLNPEGRDTIPAQFFKAGDFSKGLAVVAVYEKNQIKWGLINRSGDYVAPPGKHKMIHPFTEVGLACFQDAKTQKWGLIDTKDTVVLKPVFKKIIDTLEFPDGFMRVQADNGGIGLMLPPSEQPLLEAKYAQIQLLGERMAAAKEWGATTWKIFNLTTTPAKMINDHVFDPLSDFVGGVTLVNLAANGQSKVPMNRTGKVFHKKKDFLPAFFSEGVFGAGRKTYYSDAYGDNRFVSSFREISPLKQGVAEVMIKGWEDGWSAINNRGILLMPPKYKQKIVRKNGYLVVNPNRLYGLYDLNGRELLPPHFDRIVQFDNRIFRVELGEKVGYYRIEKNNKVLELLPLQN